MLNVVAVAGWMLGLAAAGVLDFVSIYRLVAQQRGRGDAIDVTCYGLEDKHLALGYGASQLRALPEHAANSFC